MYIDRVKYLLLLSYFNPLNADLNPICDLLALLESRHIFHVSGLMVVFSRHMFEKHSEYQISRKSGHWGLSWWADTTKLIVDFRNFPRAPKKEMPWLRILGASQGLRGLMSFMQLQLRVCCKLGVLVSFCFVYLEVWLRLGYNSLSGCIVAF